MICFKCGLIWRNQEKNSFLSTTDFVPNMIIYSISLADSVWTVIIFVLDMGNILVNVIVFNINMTVYFKVTLCMYPN